jgi:hypothetical protein
MRLGMSGARRGDPGRGLLGQHVQGRAAEPPSSQGRREGPLVDEAPAGGVDQEGARPREGDLGGADQTPGPRGQGTVE